MIGSRLWFAARARWSLVGLLTCGAIVLAACDPVLEQQYYKEGIGTEVVRSNSVDVTALQDLYLSELCRQAGLVPIGSEDGACQLPGASPSWGVIVVAGMNDIDARCDAYLAWLDDKRRSQEPILKEINALQTASQSIMRVSGVGANPITMVGLAFGLASSTFTNIRSRLLLEANHSTVQSVVLGRQKDYREGLIKQRVNIVTRAEAVYALRSYLRICMPMTIEMQINTTVAVYEQAGTEGVKLKHDHPLIDPRLVTSVALTANQPVTRPVRAQPTNQPDLSPIVDPTSPGLRSKIDLEDLQDAMCVPLSERGKIGNFTHANIEMFEIGFFADNKPRSGKLTSRQVRIIEESGICPRPGEPGKKPEAYPRNYFEKTKYPDNAAGQTALNQFVTALNAAEPANPLTNFTTIDDATRRKIKSVRRLKQQQLQTYPVDVSDQITPDLWIALGAP